jgi:hypothetical protein
MPLGGRSTRRSTGMGKRKTVYTVYRATLRVGDLGAFLDMLRYELATVENWTVQSGDRPGLGAYIVTLRSERYTPDRWSSFAIRTEVVNAFAA